MGMYVGHHTLQNAKTICLRLIAIAVLCLAPAGAALGQDCTLLSPPTLTGAGPESLIVDKAICVTASDTPYVFSHVNVVENGMEVHDLNATILHLMGIDHERLVFPFQGRDFRLTDVHGRVAHDILV